MNHNYKSHTILITSWANLDRNGFTPEFRVTRKAPIVFQNVKINQAFTTKEEAETYALDAARKWIDNASQPFKA